MTPLEIFGAAALYVIGVIVLAFVMTAIAAFTQRRAGLEGMIVMVYAWFGTMITGAVVGLVLLGRMLA